MANRRTFIKNAAVATAGVGIATGMSTAMSSCIGANNKLKCGVIGVKGMGFEDLKAFLAKENTECIALCDVDQNVLNKRVAEVGALQEKEPLAYADYRRMLENKDIDVVIIGTPDHWHCLPFVHAAELGKSIYCEKPLANSIEEVNIMERAVERYGNVVQIGQWQRSDTHWLDAVDFVHTGALGKVRTVRVWSYQGWCKSIPVVPDGAPPKGVDYDFWLGPAPKRPFNKNRFHFTFRWFWDYAGGLMTDWGVHLIDFAMFGMKVSAPKSVMAMGGKLAYPDDACETPDTMQAIYDFEDFTMLWDHGIGINAGYYGRRHGVAFVGENGTLVVDRLGWEVIPEGKNEPAMERVGLTPGDGKGLSNHMDNFIDCIKRPRKKLNANIQIGANIARVSHLGNLALKTGRRLYWDNENRVLLNDPEANKMLVPSYRAPWELPKI